MTIYLVWGGYGHDSFLLATCDEERANKLSSENGYYWVQDMELEDLGAGIDALTKELKDRQW